jgi:WD40 repeat protein
LFQHEEPTDIVIKPDMSKSWSPCLQTLEGHSADVMTVAISHDSTRLASASIDGTIKMWDPSSGACLETFDVVDTLPNNQEVSCYNFKASHDLKLMAFVRTKYVFNKAQDERVEVWDTDSRARVLTFEDFNVQNIEEVYHYVAFSQDSSSLALASNNGTFRLWDTSNFTCLQELDNYDRSYRALAFSHDLAWLASCSKIGTIEIQDASSSHTRLQTFQSDFDDDHQLAFSYDSTKLASASSYTTYIWDLSSEANSQIFTHSFKVTALAFSRNSAWLAAGHADGAIKMYDIHSGMCIQTLEGHGSFISSLAFFHDSIRLASSSTDTTIKIWDTSSIDTCLQAPKSQSSAVLGWFFSHDLTKLASYLDDGTVEIWDAVSGTCLQRLERHGDPILSVAFSYNSMWLASRGYDCTVKIWDIASNGTCLHTLEGHRSFVRDLNFSNDSNKLASISHDKKIRIWDSVRGVCMQTLESNVMDFGSLAFSHDTTLLASSIARYGTGSTVKIWDVSNGECLHALEGGLLCARSLIFSDDGTQLAFVMSSFEQKPNKESTVKIWKFKRGKCLQTFDIRTGTDWHPELLSFNQSKSCLYTDIGTIDLRGLKKHISKAIAQCWS